MRMEEDYYYHEGAELPFLPGNNTNIGMCPAHVSATAQIRMGWAIWRRQFTSEASTPSPSIAHPASMCEEVNKPG